MRLPAILCVVLLASIARGTPVQQPEEWRRQVPAAGPARPFNLPPLRQFSLSNGLSVVAMRDDRIPLATISVGIPVGSVDDPPQALGLAEATAEIATNAAGARTSEQLANAIEALGATLSVTVERDYTQFSISVVAENFRPALEILADVLVRPTFPPSEVSLYKRNRREQLAVMRQDPAFLADERFAAVVYGSHGYSSIATDPSSLDRMTRNRVAAFHKEMYRPEGGVVVACGAFDGDHLERDLTSVFNGWTGSRARSRPAPQLPQRSYRRVHLVDRPGSEQADFRVGNIAIPRLDEDFHALMVASSALGGGASSRLFLNLREEKGYTYGVASIVSARRLAGSFLVAGECRTQVTADALRELLAEFRRIRLDPVTAPELESAVGFLIGVHALTASTQGALAGRMVRGFMVGSGPDEVLDFPDRLGKVTPPQIMKAARKHIDVDRSVIVVVGSADDLLAPLRSFGPVQLYDSTGQPVRTPTHFR